MRVCVHSCIYLLLLSASSACGQNQSEISKLVYSNPVNTESRPIELQAKRKYSFARQGVSVDNLFDGARLNGVGLHENRLKVYISPENTPINGSAWYAFRIHSRRKQTIVVELNYTDGFHRYQPKWSRDGKVWTAIDEKKISVSKTGDKAAFSMMLPAGITWIAAQEIIDSKKVMAWCSKLGKNKLVTNHLVGRSALNRDIPALDISSGNNQYKPILVILGRQHPPEVTGHLALQAFVERLLQHPRATAFFKQYRVLVIPIINPDGVDLGHWRHNAQGIDLNRDYAEYQQPEIRALTTFLAKTASDSKAPIIMGLDFHSTYDDIYYTNQETEGVALAAFENEWLNAIGTGLAPFNYVLRREQHSVSTNPSAQHWFYHQFKALGITYEIGDNTERDFIKQKANVSADALIKLLLENGHPTK
jgi:cytosolic carboxypeptidase protein 6